MSLVDLVVKSMLVAALGWVAACRLRSASAATRHFALAVTLIGLCLLPVVAVLLPSWHVPFLSFRDSSAVTTVREKVALYGTAADGHGGLNLANVAIAIWGAVAACLLLRIAVRLIRLLFMQRRLPQMTDPAVTRLVDDHCRTGGHHVSILSGPAGEMPMVWGHRRSVLLLPEQASSWPRQRLNSVLLHELAHIERRDWISGLLAHFAIALNWFNPFVWIIARRMEAECETAADDRVLLAGVSATEYAEHLIEVSRELRRARPMTGVALALTRTSKLDRRVRAILEPSRSRRATQRLGAIALTSTTFVAVCVVGAATPTVVHEVLDSPLAAEVGTVALRAAKSLVAKVVSPHSQPESTVTVTHVQPHRVHRHRPAPPVAPTALAAAARPVTPAAPIPPIAPQIDGDAAAVAFGGGGASMVETGGAIVTSGEAPKGDDVEQADQGGQAGQSLESDGDASADPQADAAVMEKRQAESDAQGYQGDEGAEQLKAQQEDAKESCQEAEQKTRAEQEAQRERQKELAEADKERTKALAEAARERDKALAEPPGSGTER